MKDCTFGTYKVLTCRSSDNEVDIDALHPTPTTPSNPSSKPTKPLPTIVIVHGGPTASNLVQFDTSDDNYWSAYALSKGAVTQAELAGGAPCMAARDDTQGRQGSALWEMAHAVAKAQGTGEEVIPPVLILHAENDVQHSTSQADGFHHGGRAHGLACEFVKYPGEGYGLNLHRFRLDALQRAMRWAAMHIGPGEPFPEHMKE